MPLLVHGEIDAPGGRCVRPRGALHRRGARAADRALPALKVVFEHITTARAVEFVARRARRGRGDHHAAASAAQPQRHFRGRHPAALLLPADPEARARPRGAASQAATGGNPRFFLGTDSAPHERATKENACGCAGMFTAHAAIELYAEVFEQAGRLDRLEAFASHFGADFYGLPRHDGAHHPDQGALGACRRSTTSAAAAVVPYRAGETIAWRLARGGARMTAACRPSPSPRAFAAFCRW